MSQVGVVSPCLAQTDLQKLKVVGPMQDAQSNQSRLREEHG
jgi:hypothetical protein